MWNCSAPHSFLLPFGDDYVKCESSSSPAAAVGLDKILAAEYDLCHTLNLSPSLHGLQTPTLFAMHGSDGYLGSSPIYGGEAQPTFAQFSCTQPTPATHLVKWTAAAGETTTTAAGDGSRLRGSKRLRTTTAQGPQQHGLRCNARSAGNQSVKAPCKRSQKLGDKITALQQLVSPYGKTDTASVLHEAATCIKQLHEQIQILTASYPAIGSPASHQDIGDDEGATDLRRRGLCLAPLSPAVVQLVSAEAARVHRDATDMEGRWRWLGAL